MINRTHTAVAIAILAILFAGVLTPAITPLQDVRFIFVWPIAFGGILAFVSMWKSNSNSSWPARLFVSSILGLGAYMAGWMVALMVSLMLNVILDVSPQRQRVMKIESKGVRASKARTSYFSVRDVNDGLRVELNVVKKLFLRKSVGDRVLVTTRAGGLGVERVERVE